MLQKVTFEEYKAKLLLYHSEKDFPEIKICRYGKKIVLKRTYCEEYLIENLDNPETKC